MTHHFLALTLSLCLLACATRRFNPSTSEIQAANGRVEWKAGGKVSTGPQTTYLYHWTNDPEARTNPHKYLGETIKKARMLNQNWERSGDLIVGHGIYVANDPISSRSYGRTLVSIPIKANQTFDIKTYSSEQNKALVASDSKGIVYEFPGLGRDKIGRHIPYALVIRHDDVIDWPNVKVYGPMPDCKKSSALQNVPRQEPLAQRISYAVTSTCLQMTGSHLVFRNTDVPEALIISQRGIDLERALLTKHPTLDFSDLKDCSDDSLEHNTCLKVIFDTVETLNRAPKVGLSPSVLIGAKRAGLVPASSASMTPQEFSKTVAASVKMDYGNVLRVDLEIFAFLESVLVETDKIGMGLWHEEH